MNSVQIHGPLILGSQSPRRRQLMEEAGYDFTVVTPSDTAECGMCSRETPPELVARLAWQKAQDVAKRTESGIVIGCDTVAECMGQILGKPKSREHAEEMLRLMSGRKHQVFSGLCLWRRPDDDVHVEVEVTSLFMNQITEAELEQHLDSDAWEGKAGAFGYQDGLDWVHIESGSESNVVGLPMELLAKMLGKLTAS
jgi:septum formation protein